MTAATITPAVAGADLIAELQQLVEQAKNASTAAEVRRLCDNAAKVIGRARRRVTRYEQQAIALAEQKPQPEPKPAEQPKPVPARPPAPPRADVRLPAEPKPQQEPPPEPPPEAPETPPLPPTGPRSWGAWLNSALLAVVATVNALILAGRAICSLVARAGRSAVRFVARRSRRVRAALLLRGER
jgi:hypothetical protein